MNVMFLFSVWNRIYSGKLIFSSRKVWRLNFLVTWRQFFDFDLNLHKADRLYDLFYILKTDIFHFNLF